MKVPHLHSGRAAAEWKAGTGRVCARAVHFISHLQQHVPYLIQHPVPPTSCNVLYAGEDMKASLSNTNNARHRQWLSPLPVTLWTRSSVARNGNSSTLFGIFSLEIAKVCFEKKHLVFYMSSVPKHTWYYYIPWQYCCIWYILRIIVNTIVFGTWCILNTMFFTCFTFKDF